MKSPGEEVCMVTPRDRGRRRLKRVKLGRGSIVKGSGEERLGLAQEIA